MKDVDDRSPVRTVAVVGGGAAGLVSACLLDGAYDVTLFEAGDYVGGHARTVVVPGGPDAGLPLDIGFVNCTRAAYPTVYRYFDRLGIETPPSDGSFCVYDEAAQDYYAFSLEDGGRAELPLSDGAQRILWRLLKEVTRLYTRAAKDLASGAMAGLSLREYAEVCGVSADFVRQFMIPVYSSLWVVPPGEVLNLSAESVFGFYRRMGLPSLKDYNPRYVVGGSKTYIQAMLAGFGGKVRLKTGVERVFRTADHVELGLADGSRERFDAVVIGLHADDALAVLDDPSPDEARLLGPWKYAPTRTVLHTDRRVIPGRQGRPASFNYVAGADDRTESNVGVTYWLNGVMSFQAAADYFVSLNPRVHIDPATILYETDWRHPVFDVASVATQSELHRLSGVRRTYFCGGYHSCGSHEDAFASAEATAARFGVLHG